MLQKHGYDDFVDVNYIFDLKMEDGMEVSNYLCEEVFKEPKEKLNILINFFIETFRNPAIVTSSVAGQVVYRGIVGFTVDDKAVLLEPTKSFTSTSTDKNIALSHIALMPSRMNNNIEKSVILEMHLAPGIQYIDYNSLMPSDTVNIKQKEIILPPGLHFVEKEIQRVNTTENITGTFSGKKTIKTHYDVLVVEVSAKSFKGGGKRHKKLSRSKR
jgi:hypothetical protein